MTQKLERKNIPMHNVQSNAHTSKKGTESLWNPLKKLPFPGKKAKSSKKKRISRYEIPGVVVRGVENFPTIQQGGRHQKAAVRPRKDVHLRNSNGVSITLPAIPQVHLGWRLLSLVFVLGIGLILYYSWTAPFFKIKDLDVTGLVRTPQNEVLDFLQIEGKPSFTLSPNDLVSSLQENYPEFSDVAVKVGFPDRVAITVTERIPVIAWNLPDRTILLDQDGYSFPLRLNYETGIIPNVQSEELPVGFSIPQETPVEISNLGSDQENNKSEETNNFVEEAVSINTIEAVLSLTEQAPQDSPIIFSNEHGFGWQDPGGWEVYFGNAQDMNMKLSVYHALLKLLDSNDTRPTLVSVEWVDAPYYRLEP